MILALSLLLASCGGDDAPRVDAAPGMSPDGSRPDTGHVARIAAACDKYCVAISTATGCANETRERARSECQYSCDNNLKLLPASCEMPFTAMYNCLSGQSYRCVNEGSPPSASNPCTTEIMMANQCIIGSAH